MTQKRRSATPIAEALLRRCQGVRPAFMASESIHLARALQLTTDPAVRRRIGELADCWASHLFHHDRDAGHHLWHLAQAGYGADECRWCKLPIADVLEGAAA